MFKNKIHTLSIVAAFVTALVLMLGISGAAFADTPQGTLQITGGSLIESAPTITINSNNTVAQTGADQILPVSMPISVTDATGTGSGWKVTLAASTFNDGGSNSLHNVPTVSNVTAAAVNGSTSTIPTNTTSYTNYSVPTSSATTLFNATAGTGMGQFTLTPVMSLKVQGNDKVATYTSTFTLAIVTGP